MSNGSPLRNRAMQSIVWSMVRFGGDQIFNFIVFAAMARYLIPAQFGVFVVALVFVEFGKILASAGLVNSIYRAETLTPRLLDTVFWANVGLGCIVALVGWLFADHIANALGSPAAASVIAILGLLVPISALGATHMARNLREFGHRALAVRSLISGVLGGSLAILALINGYGLWALVIQRFVAETINTLVAWFSFRWKPGFEFSWSTLRDQLGLGGSMAGSQLLLLALARSQDIILARGVGIAAVGAYRTAWKTVELVAQGVISPFSNVALPALTKLRFDMKAFERGYLKMVGASALISFPALVGAGVLADQLIPLLYGPQWQNSIPIAQVLTFLALPFSLDFFADPAMVVLKKSSFIIRLSAIKLVTTLTFCIAAVPYGIVAVAIAYVARAYLTMIVQLLMFDRATGIQPIAVLKAVAPQLAAALVMGVVLIVFTQIVRPELFPAGILGHVIRLVISVALGVVVYGASLYVFLGAALRQDMVTTVRGLRRSSKPALEEV